jgi:hypothetical protein
MYKMFKKDKIKKKLKKFNIKKIIPNFKKVFKKNLSLLYISILLILASDLYIVYEGWDSEDSEVETLVWIKGFTSTMLIGGLLVGWNELP